MWSRKSLELRGVENLVFHRGVQTPNPKFWHQILKPKMLGWNLASPTPFCFLVSLEPRHDLYVLFMGLHICTFCYKFVTELLQSCYRAVTGLLQSWYNQNKPWEQQWYERKKILEHHMSLWALAIKNGHWRRASGSRSSRPCSRGSV